MLLDKVTKTRASETVKPYASHMPYIEIASIQRERIKTGQFTGGRGWIFQMHTLTNNVLI